jgi:hypothetical protein
MRDPSTIYRGLKRANEGGPGRVFVEEPGMLTRPLDPRFDLRNHSPDGFQWGYGGSGPAQLALALLADATDDETAQRYYQEFKFAVVARLADEWTVDAASIQKLVAVPQP